jgi:hypothetical protein
MAEQHAYPSYSSKMTFQLFRHWQDWRTERPETLVSLERARELKKAGSHYFPPATNGVLVELPKEARQRQETEEKHTGWRVVNQTAKPDIVHKETMIGPGDPHYCLV